MAIGPIQLLKQASPGQRRTLLAAALGWMLDAFAAMLYALVLAYVMRDLGMSKATSGLLYTLTQEHPLRESFYGQLMLALYRSERRGDALRVYLSARTVLIDELGLEPCRPLQDLHRSILRSNDAGLLAPMAMAV